MAYLRHTVCGWIYLLPSFCTHFVRPTVDPLRSRDNSSSSYRWSRFMAGFVTLPLMASQTLLLSQVYSLAKTLTTNVSMDLVLLWHTRFLRICSHFPLVPSRMMFCLSGVTVNTLHPGTVNTQLLRNLPFVLRAAFQVVGFLFFKVRFWPIMRPLKRYVAQWRV